MAETHEVELPDNQRLTVEDPEPLRSARLFKFVSDALWSRRPVGYDWLTFGTNTVLPDPEALALVHETVAGIDTTLVPALSKKNLKLIGSYGEKVLIPRSELQVPSQISVNTMNWDERFGYRQLMVDGERTYGAFVDGHVDYARQLSVNLHFDVDKANLTTSYVMQRYQDGQADPTTLNNSVWYSAFAESGYEGNSYGSTELTEAQEITMLEAIAKIGGISLEGF